MNKISNNNTARKKLLERKVVLEEELAELYKTKVANDEVKDTGDQIVSLSLETLTSSLQDTELEEYNRILKALKMLDDGTYGTCADCNTVISEKRLKSYPDATRCLVCQEAFEEGG